MINGEWSSEFLRCLQAGELARSITDEYSPFPDSTVNGLLYSSFTIHYLQFPGLRQV